MADETERDDSPARPGTDRGEGPGDPRLDRAVAPVTGKIMEVGLVALYVGVVATSLYAGVVPGYQSAAGAEVAERTLATANQRVQQAVPSNGTHVQATAAVDLPGAIAGRSYEVRADGRRLVLDHPDRDVATSSRLAVPGHVVDVTGNWSSSRPAHVRVRGTPRGLVVRLEVGRP